MGQRRASSDQRAQSSRLRSGTRSLSRRRTIVSVVAVARYVRYPQDRAVFPQLTRGSPRQSRSRRQKTTSIMPPSAWPPRASKTTSSSPILISSGPSFPLAPSVHASAKSLVFLSTRCPEIFCLTTHFPTMVQLRLSMRPRRLSKRRQNSGTRTSRQGSSRTSSTLMISQLLRVFILINMAPITDTHFF